MENDLKLLTRQMKALSNEHRLALFLKILSHEQTHGRQEGCLISEMVCEWTICAPTVSHHVRHLQLAGLIDIEKHGKYIIARTNLEAFTLTMRLFRVRPIDAPMAHLYDTLMPQQTPAPNTPDSP